LQENRPQHVAFLQNPKLQMPSSTNPINGLEIVHGRLLTQRPTGLSFLFYLLLFPIVFGWGAWRHYRWANYVDSVGPEAEPPFEN